jgi:hypothetical protein
MPDGSTKTPGHHPKEMCWGQEMSAWHAGGEKPARLSVRCCLALFLFLSFPRCPCDDHDHDHEEIARNVRRSDRGDVLFSSLKPSTAAPMRTMWLASGLLLLLLLLLITTCSINKACRGWLSVLGRLKRQEVLPPPARHPLLQQKDRLLPRWTIDTYDP